MLKRAAIVVAIVVFGVLTGGTIASAQEPPPPAPKADTQDGLINVNLLNNLAVCPDIGVVASLGNVLGILGVGSSDPEVAGDSITCVVDDSVKLGG
ncbi:hypothetical protein [Pseudonocardia sp. TRM90224]|uniref:hypothetical protein n=1 Tax=Pseudonocardia sp. TRM90224 TaxID=2812678 RepID=UPI001E508CE1|nr:hypothetical protein [Pseudonocardia sp. TRM90224]